MWIGVLHHVCGEHEWAGSKCSHGEIDDSDKTPLKKATKTMDSLRDVVLDKKFKDNLQFYTRFR